MSLQSSAGHVVLAASSSVGVVNWMGNLDTAVSIIVGVLSAVGIIYSIAWHRVRIKQAREKARAKAKSE